MDTNEAAAAASGQPTAICPEELADFVRLAHMFLAHVDASGSEGIPLRADSALITVARRIVRATPEERHDNRTAIMALRDVTWRLETARYMLAERLGDREGRAVLEMLDTADIRLFLRQEP